MTSARTAQTEEYPQSMVVAGDYGPADVVVAHAVVETDDVGDAAGGGAGEAIGESPDGGDGADGGNAEGGDLRVQR